VDEQHYISSYCERHWGGDRSISWYFNDHLYDIIRLPVDRCSDGQYGSDGNNRHITVVHRCMYDAFGYGIWRYVERQHDISDGEQCERSGLRSLFGHVSDHVFLRIWL